MKLKVVFLIVMIIIHQMKVLSEIHYPKFKHNVYISDFKHSNYGSIVNELNLLLGHNINNNCNY